MDWTKCVICQLDDSDVLRNPVDSNRSDDSEVYDKFYKNLLEFQTLDCLPVQNLKLKNVSAIDLKTNNALWHRKCSLKFSDLKLERAKKRKNSENATKITSSSCSPVKTRRLRNSQSFSVCSTLEICIFCNKSGGELHNASTENISATVKRYATDLNDTNLLVKISGACDLLAMDAKYHLTCLTALYCRHRSYMNLKNKDCLDMSRIHSVAIAHVVNYLEEEREESENGSVMFKLVDISQIYKTKLQELGVIQEVHQTRLKDRLCSLLYGLETVTVGREILLTYKENISAAVKDAYDQRNNDLEQIALTRVARKIRKEIIPICFPDKNKNNVQNDNLCSENLYNIISYLMYGKIVQNNLNPVAAVKTVCEIITYNTKKNVRSGDQSPAYQRHKNTRNSELLVYVAMKIWSETRNKNIIDQLASLGLCISYSKLSEYKKKIANTACMQYHKDNVVCPLQLPRGLFTTAAIDNIDHNTSSTTANESFHGTAISLKSHPTNENNGELRGYIDINDTNLLSASTDYLPLPESYSIVPAVSRALSSSDMPACPPFSIPTAAVQLDYKHEDLEWLQRVYESAENLLEAANINWSSHHAEKMRLIKRPNTKIAMLPIFTEQSHSYAMILHALNVIIAALQYLNFGQVPVAVLDQPLYAIAKQIQWMTPDTHGEDKLVIMFGALHIEMNAWKMVGKWMKGSGIVEILAEAEIMTHGRAESLIHASHLKRTRNTYTVIAASLFILQKKSYEYYCLNHTSTEVLLTFDEYISRQNSEVPIFQYWNITLKLILLVLQLVRSLRESNFNLYVTSTTCLAPWFFALDHINYARWLSVHIRDMHNLKDKNPSVASEFAKGHFTAVKSQRNFSAIALDEAHEQENAVIKGSGGIIGITSDQKSLQDWQLASPEISKYIVQYEQQYDTSKEKNLHHQQTATLNRKFIENVRKLVHAMDELHSPFVATYSELHNLYTKQVPQCDVVSTVKNIVSNGLLQFKTFTEERLVKKQKNVTDHMTLNRYKLFSSDPQKKNSNNKIADKMSTLRNDTATFGAMLAACKVREGNFEFFFSHENQATPRSLASAGQMSTTNKSALLKILEKHSTTQEPVDSNVIIIDGAALIHRLVPPRQYKTFSEYENYFLKNIENKLKLAARVEIVFDVYEKSSLKTATRLSRGSTGRRRVFSNSPLPNDWTTFLLNAENKTELFTLLAQSITKINIGTKIVIATCGEDVISNPPSLNVTRLAPCTHEEADTRLMLHTVNAVEDGNNKITIDSVDTDVVVLCIAAAVKLHPAEIWVAFAVKNNFRYIAAHEIAAVLGPQKACALPMFHAFTGCDTVSSFTNYGKNKAYKAWTAYPEVTAAFLQLSSSPQNIEAVRPVLERFVVVLYDRTSEHTSVDAARYDLFDKGRPLDKIPPTLGALEQHIRRAVYQGGHIWGQMFIRSPERPCPGDWGWHRKR